MFYPDQCHLPFSELEDRPRDEIKYAGFHLEGSTPIKEKECKNLLGMFSLNRFGYRRFFQWQHQ